MTSWLLRTAIYLLDSAAVIVVLFTIPSTFHYNSQTLLDAAWGWRVLYFTAAFVYSFVCLFNMYAIDVVRFVVRFIAFSVAKSKR
ncbi:hypothetical protein DXN05_23515 [Deminuibacter soli]|uniref:Uncharacterized protein n=1 Tax=Deminuibacter soli TaxID=2291815 RepID=A0A3E1NCZ1_9BACT|nr:hypothetical protein DXN05_23515 [Deminuibacter soli]